MATARKSDVTAEIKAANKEGLSAAIAAGDGAAAAACYTADAILMPQGAPPCKTGRSIAKFWQSVIDGGLKGVALRTVEVEQHGRTAIEWGNYTLKGARGKVLDKGKYVVVWKRAGRSWKMHRDIFNSNG